MHTYGTRICLCAYIVRYYRKLSYETDAEEFVRKDLVDRLTGSIRPRLEFFEPVFLQSLLLIDVCHTSKAYQ